MLNLSSSFDEDQPVKRFASEFSMMKKVIGERIADNQKFENEKQFLEGITTDLDLSKDVEIQKIWFVASNKFNSLMVIEIKSNSLQRIYEGQYIMRCYRSKKKFFEMPLRKYVTLKVLAGKPLFIDLYDTTIAYVLEGEDHQNCFYAIDVGRVKNEELEIPETIKGMPAPRRYEHSFSEEIIGFKICHFVRRNEGLRKAVFWSSEKMYMYAFCPTLDEEAEKDDAQIDNNREEIELEDCYVKKIYSIGVNPATFAEYDEDYPEFVLAMEEADEDDATFKILKGERYGKIFKPMDDFNYEDIFAWITKIYDMKLISTSKILVLMDKKVEDSDKTNLVYQIIEIDVKEQNLRFGRHFFAVHDLLQDIADGKDLFGDELVVDGMNEIFYFKHRKSGKDVMIQVPIRNNLQNKADMLIGTPEIMKNITGNHLPILQEGVKTKGLLYKDFLVAGCYLYLIHGPVITVINHVNRKESPQHISLDTFNQMDPYDFSCEPQAIWMMDKETVDTKHRWKVIVLFKNGEVKELRKSRRKEFKLTTYLIDKNDQPDRIPGTVKKVLRNKHTKNQPIYFIVKLHGSDSRCVLGTIEFYSRTFRQYTIPETNDDTMYVILDMPDSEKMWQEVACFTTYGDKEQKVQKMIHAKVRIGQYYVTPDHDIINQEQLAPEIQDVSQAAEIFVSGSYIFFVFKADRTKKDGKPHIERYNLEDNSHIKVLISETITRLKCFEGEYFYWRTVLGGFNDNKYQSNIYFDGVGDFSQFNKSHNEEIMIFKGIYPHLQKLQYDIINESIACFINFNQMRIFPLLHTNSIKVNVEGDKDSDDHILATKFVPDFYLVTLHQKNIFNVWSMKTGKYLYISNQVDNMLDFSSYIWHQRISDEYTLIREKNHLDPELFQSNPALSKVNWVDENNNIQMYKYRVIKFDYKMKDEVLDHTSLQVVVEKEFIGPGYSSSDDFGLYCGDELDQLVFFFRDTQEKIQLIYCKFSEDLTYEDKVAGTSYQTIQRIKKASKYNARLTYHSPNFKQLVVQAQEPGQGYAIKYYNDESVLYFLPENLNSNTIEAPNFLLNDLVLFMTEDKMVKGIKVEIQEELQEGLEGPGQKTLVTNEEFLITHCSFPGSTDTISLATILCFGKPDNRHLIGENCLTYYQVIKDLIVPNHEGKEIQKLDKKEFISPNIYNKFFLECASDYIESLDYSEIKVIQAHYKSKFEMDKRSIFGYFFRQKSSNYEICTQLYVTSTFNFYQWRIMNLIREKKVSPKSLLTKTLQDLSYCQLANGQTLLHTLYKDKESLGHIFETVAIYDDEENQFHVPLFKNRDNMTALDYTLNFKEEDDPAKETGRYEPKPVFANFMDFKSREQTGAEIEQTGTIYRKSAELILKHIGLYPFNLFKVELKHLVSIMIEEQIMEFGSYMLNSAKQPSFLKSIDRAKIIYEDTCGAYVFEADEVWSSNPAQNFNYTNTEGEDKLVQVKVIDVPRLHHYTNSKDNVIFKSLSSTDDTSVFEVLTVKAIIEQKWPLTKYKVIWWLLLPYLVTLLIFTYYTVFDLETSYEDKQSELVDPLVVNQGMETLASVVCRILIILCTSYFLAIEVYQCLREGLKEHFSDFWNYLDIIPPIFIFTAELLNLFNFVDYRLIRTLYAYTAIVMWLRFLYFFRIYKATNFYIKMIQEVIKDMGQFFFILAIAIIAFGHTFFIYFKNHNVVTTEVIVLDDGTEEVIKTQQSVSEFGNFAYAMLYSYLLSIGEFGTDNFPIFGETAAWFFFILSTLFVLIVMLNLLISIVSETFGRVNGEKERIMYQDMVDLIVENQFLITEQEMESMNKGKYLVLVIPEDTIKDDQEQILQNFEDLKASITQSKKENMLKNQQMEYNLDRVIKTLKTLQKDLSYVKKFQDILVEKMAPESLPKNQLTTQLGKKFGSKLISKKMLTKTSLKKDPVTSSPQKKEGEPEEEKTGGLGFLQSLGQQIQQVVSKEPEPVEEEAPKEKKKRKGSDEEEEEEEEEKEEVKPKQKRKGSDEEEEEEEKSKPKKKRKGSDDEEEEKPKPKKKRKGSDDEEEEEEEEKPKSKKKRKGSDEEEEEEEEEKPKPKKKRKGSDEDDE